MLPGVFLSKKKNGSCYYRSSITYKSKHISLGSYETEETAHAAYVQAAALLKCPPASLMEAFDTISALPYEKIVILVNFVNNGYYIPAPIYLHRNYFSYFLSKSEEYKFDIDDLFYYSGHRILRRRGHLYVNDYGMQYSILGRYGIHSHSVAGKDYIFVNGDPTDFRYSNIKVINKYHGVERTLSGGRFMYRVCLHIRSSYVIGTYPDEITAAVAYNKAVDAAHKAGVERRFPVNFITELSADAYASLYREVSISTRFLNSPGQKS